MCMLISKLHLNNFSNMIQVYLKSESLLSQTLLEDKHNNVPCSLLISFHFSHLPASNYLWHSSLFYCYDSFMPFVLVSIKNNKKKLHSVNSSTPELLIALVLKPSWTVCCLGQLWPSSSNPIFNLIPSHNKMKSQQHFQHTPLQNTQTIANSKQHTNSLIYSVLPHQDTHCMNLTLQLCFFRGVNVFLLMSLPFSSQHLHCSRISTGNSKDKRWRGWGWIKWTTTDLQKIMQGVSHPKLSSIVTVHEFMDLHCFTLCKTCCNTYVPILKNHQTYISASCLKTIKHKVVLKNK